MNRLFGVGNGNKEVVSLEEATGKIDNRILAIDGKIKVLDEQIAQVQKQLSVIRPGSGNRDSLRSQARSLLTQRRSLLTHRQQLQSQSLNLFQIDLAASNVRDAQDTLKTMQGVKRELQRGIGRVRPEMVEVLGEDVSELLADSWEVQELLGRSYQTGGEVLGEDDLEEELRMMEQNSLGGEEDVWDRVLQNPEDVKVDLPPIPPTTSTKYPDLDYYQNKN